MFVRQWYDDSILFVDEGIKILDHIDQICWEAQGGQDVERNEGDFRQIAQIIGQHAFLINFVRGEPKTEVNPNDHSRIRVAIMTAMIQGYLLNVENWEKVDNAYESKNCYEMARLLGEKGTQLMDQKFEKVIKMKNELDADARFEYSLGTNLDYIKQSYDLNVPGEGERTQTTSYRGQEQEQEQNSEYGSIDLREMLIEDNLL